RQAALTFEKHEVRLESFHRSQHDVWAIGNHLAPEFPARVARWSGHQAKGPPPGIRANVKHATCLVWDQTGMSRGKRAWMMLRIVFMVVLTRGDEPEFSAGLISAQVANFAGRMARDGQKKESAAARAFHFDSKPLVRFVVN